MTKPEVNVDLKPMASASNSRPPPYRGNNNRSRVPPSTQFVGSEMALNLKKVKFDYGDGNTGVSSPRTFNTSLSSWELRAPMLVTSDIQTTIEEQAVKDIPDSKPHE